MTYKVCIPNGFLNCDKIYPIQQKKIKELIDELSQKEAVEKIIIFGSSVTQMCHIGSDVDLYVVLSEKVPKLINKPLNFAYDLWTNFDTDERLQSEIDKTGVTVYAGRTKE